MSEGASSTENGESSSSYVPWETPLIITALVASMVVNALVTGLIVFKILVVLLEVKRLQPEATSVEKTLGSLSSTGGIKLRQIIFIIIESGMALFAIQLVRVVITSLYELQGGRISPGLLFSFELASIIHEMLNVIVTSVYFYFYFTDDIYMIQGIAPTLILVRVSMGLSIDEEESFKEALRFNNPPSDPNSLQPVESMPSQEINESEDIC